MKKTVIAIKGLSERGKSDTIKRLRHLINSSYKTTETVYEDSGDIKVIIQLKSIKVGIESQGDPNSRQPKSIDDFIKAQCDIIICTCRTKNDTKRAVLNTKNVGYRIIWGTNYRSSSASHTDLNEISAKHFLELFNQIISGII